MIFVAGVGGTVGSEVLKQLRALGARVRAGIHSPEKRAQALSDGIDAVDIDFGDRASLRRTLAGANKLFLLGATLPNQSELESAVAEEAKLAGVGHIVKLSVLDAASEGYTFARWHRRAERTIESLGVTYTFVRPNGFMQNFVNYYGPTIRGRGVFYSAVPDVPVSHVDVRDIAAVAVIALTQSGQENRAYNVTGPAALTHRQAAAVLSKVAGRDIKVVTVSFEELRQSSLHAGIPEFYVDALIDLTEYYAQGKAAEVSDAVQRVTGQQAISFEQFVGDYQELWQAEGVGSAG